MQIKSLFSFDFLLSTFDFWLSTFVFFCIFYHLFMPVFFVLFPQLYAGFRVLWGHFWPIVSFLVRDTIPPVITLISMFIVPDNIRLCHDFAAFFIFTRAHAFILYIFIMNILIDPFFCNISTLNLLWRKNPKKAQKNRYWKSISYKENAFLVYFFC